jgi:hypothetical protein
MNNAYYAHSENDLGKKHSLLGHLNETANIAESFTHNKEFTRLFRLAGLLHDFGKYRVAPHMGAWIETYPLVWTDKRVFVAPRGRGDEQHSSSDK